MAKESESAAASRRHPAGCAARLRHGGLSPPPAHRAHGLSPVPWVQPRSVPPWDSALSSGDGASHGWALARGLTPASPRPHALPAVPTPVSPRLCQPWDMGGRTPRGLTPAGAAAASPRRGGGTRLFPVLHARLGEPVHPAPCARLPHRSASSAGGPGPRRFCCSPGAEQEGPRPARGPALPGQSPPVLRQGRQEVLGGGRCAHTFPARLPAPSSGSPRCRGGRRAPGPVWRSGELAAGTVLPPAPRTTRPRMHRLVARSQAARKQMPSCQPGLA